MTEQTPPPSELMGPVSQEVAETLGLIDESQKDAGGDDEG